MSRFRPLVGHVLVFTVFVDGPPPAAFTDAEKIQALLAVYGGTGVLRRLSKVWGDGQTPPVPGVCGFTVLGRTLKLTRTPVDPTTTAKTFEARDRLWLEDATAQLGFASGLLSERFEGIRRQLFKESFLQLGVGDAFPLFITKYPCYHPAYQSAGAVVVQWPDLFALYPHNLDGPVAHEIGHVFDAPDEYIDHCRMTDLAGFFDTPNTNCFLASTNPSVPNPGPRSECLMDHNTHNFCQHTPLHWGWTDGDLDGFPDLMAPATISLPEHATSPGELFTINGRNVWDARVVSFGDQLTQGPPIVSTPDSITVRVPPSVTGIVNVSLLTRAGLATGSFEDTWVLVAPALPPSFSSGPAIFGLMPQSAPPGTTVKILGAGLSFPTSVTFGGVPADLSGLPDFPDGLGRELDVPVPAGPSGTVPVVVTTSQGTTPPFPPFSDFTYP